MYPPETTADGNPADRNAVGRLPIAVLLTGAFLALLPFFVLAFFAFPSADDFCFAVESRKGFWQAQRIAYLGWSGRYASTFFLSLFGLSDLSKINSLFSFLTLAATLLSFRVVIASLYEEKIAGLRLWAAAGTAMAVFTGNLPSIVENFYWMSSAITYQWSVITYFLWLALLFRIKKNTDEPKSTAATKIAAVALTFILPGFNEIFVPVIIATLVLMILKYRLYTHENKNFYLFLLFISVLLCAVMVLAPGNKLRSDSYPKHASRHNPGFALRETALMTSRFLAHYASYLPLWLSAVAFSLWLPLPRGKQGDQRTALTKLIVAACVTILIVFMTLFPLYWEYGNENRTGEGRTYNVTYLFFSIAAIWFGATVFSRIREDFSTMRSFIRQHKTKITLFPQWSAWFAVALFFTLMLAVTCKGNYLLEMDLSATRPTDFKIYWSGTGNQYHEDRSTTIPLKEGAHSYTLSFGTFADIRRLRIDPMELPGTVCFRELKLRHPWYGSVRFKEEKDFNKWRMLHDIGRAAFTQDGYCITSDAGNNALSRTETPPPDPYFDFALDIQNRKILLLLWIIKWIGGSLLLTWIIFISISLLIRFIDNNFSSHASEKIRKLFDMSLALTIAATVISSHGTIISLNALKLAPDYLFFQMQREEIIKSGGFHNKDITVSDMPFHLPPLSWGDAMPGSDHWINKCMATYYGVSSLKTR